MRPPLCQMYLPESYARCSGGGAQMMGRGMVGAGGRGGRGRGPMGGMMGPGEFGMMPGYGPGPGPNGFPGAWLAQPPQTLRACCAAPDVINFLAAM